MCDNDIVTSKQLPVNNLEFLEFLVIMIIFGPSMLNFYEPPSIGMKTFPTGIPTEDMKVAGGIQPNKITYRSWDQKTWILRNPRGSQA